MKIFVRMAGIARTKGTVLDEMLKSAGSGLKFGFKCYRFKI